MAPGTQPSRLAGELVDQRDPGLDQVLAGARQRPTDLGRLAVWGERGQAVAIGAQHISQHIRVGGIGLGPAGPIPVGQALDLPWGDHHHAQVGLQHSFHQRTVAAFDRHAGHPEGAQTLDEPGKALAGVGDLEAGTDLTGLVNHADRMGLGRPVDTGVVQLGKLLHLAAPSCQDRGTAGVGGWAGCSLRGAQGCVSLVPVAAPRPVGSRRSRDGPQETSGIGGLPTCTGGSTGSLIRPLLNLWDLREGSTNERYPADNHGHSEKAGGLGAPPLTLSGGGGRNCMACKGSGVQIPSAPPGTTHRQGSHSGPSVSRSSADHST